MTKSATPKPKHVFTKYQAFVIAILAILQFTIILDFMVLSPLGAILLKELNIKTTQFGMVVSVYAFSAGIAGLFAAGFADKFDRKKLLLFFYAGFIIGTFLCGIATDYQFLLIARVVTGLFGGVIGSIGFAIITDLFDIHVRGRVMGFVQMAFASSQVLGIPAGLYLANHLNWHAPFMMIAALSVIIFVLIMLKLKPIDAHLKLKTEHNALEHLFATASKPEYLRAFAATVLLATGGFMLMPFGSAFSVNNLGIPLDQLSFVYLITGIFSMIVGPLAGTLSDKIGKYKLFVLGSVLGMIFVSVYTRLGITPLWIVILLNCLLFMSITARMVSASALISAIPEAKDRGAFMSVNSSIQQFAGGIASAAAGLLVSQAPDGKMVHYERLGYVVIAAMAIVIIMMYFINRFVVHKVAPTATPATEPVV